MVINSPNVTINKIEPKDLCGVVSQTSNLPSHFMTLTITSSQSSDSRYRRKGMTSPYLEGDEVKLSRVTEKKLIHKQPFDSSFPLAANIYKANSDEFRTPKRINKKVKKSVLTLPNESSTDGIVGTVSDVNDVTEYSKDQRDREHKIKSKKRLPKQNRKPRIQNKDLFYDKDARYYSQMNIDLDCSSTDLKKNYNGDGRRLSKNKTTSKVSESDCKLDPHDVWAVLRNINQFQFTPSPPMSDYSIQSQKKKRTNRKVNSRKDTRVIETCRTEEFAYISSYDLNRSRTSFSPTSSIDRITVIDKRDEPSKFCKDIGKKFAKTTNLKNVKNIKVLNNKIEPGTNIVKRNTKIVKSISKYREADNQLVDLYDEKVSNILSGKQQNVSAKEKTDKAKEKHATKSHDYARLSSKDDDKIDRKKNADNVSTELEVANETICSVNSGSSKAGLHDFVNKKMAEKSKLIHSDESNQQLKGITKVAVISKAPEDARNLTMSTPMRKPRLLTTMPSSNPKLTQTEIRRRLANLKFPIVILEKDELGCSSIEVPTFEPIQFRGLTEHMWPFMKDWNWNDDKVKSPTQNNNYADTGKCTSKDRGKQTVPRNNNNFTESKAVASNDKRFNIYNMKKTEPKCQNIVHESYPIVQQPITKLKPMKQFKDKILKVLYKKSVEDINNQIYGQSDTIEQILLHNLNTEKQTRTIETGTGTVEMSYQKIPVQMNQRLIASPKKKDPKQIITPITRHPWARGKWYSDFIDSVIKKIKNGIYYNQEHLMLCKKCCKDSKEVSVQTALTMKCEESLNAISKMADTTKQTTKYKTIPGFDNVLTPVEIKTLNMKQITVKHCLENVLLQFDVCVATDKKPISFESPKYIYATPTKTESIKIIKYKTSIINSIMPAELCSIIPEMIQNISNFNTNLQFTFPPISPRTQDFQLATITELTQSNSVDSFKYSITPFSFTSEKLKSFLRGKYGQFVLNIKHQRTPVKKIRNISSPKVLVKQLCIKIDMVPLLCHHHIFYEDTIKLIVKNLRNPLFKNKILLDTKPSTSRCMALQAYIAPKQFVTPIFDIYNVTKLLHDICFKNVVVNFEFPKYFPVRLSDIKITVYKKSSPKYIQEVSVANNLKVDSIFDGFLENSQFEPKQNCFGNSAKCIEYSKQSNRSQDKKQKSCLNLSNNKTKKCFVKLYKKCKSTSNIALEKTSTALSKITNLDHFLQALGTGKLLSSVFDGNSEKKIISSIAEMKNWITDISQRQAMLVLLLTNKKDTPNLVRYRPVLLQGIAVNRITRASELDMEIEVIETENVNKLSHYEGMTYSASAQRNNILEELYWIAKTTASDYQKPFDESSERLLKSLTEKRKMLNPSYLRVMARYVGLGLLKPPKK